MKFSISSTLFLVFSLVSVISTDSAAADGRGILVVGQDNFKPFTTYFRIKKIMGNAVSKGRVNYFEARVVGIEGIQNFCIQFDETASEEDIKALKSELLSIPGLSTKQEFAYVGLLASVSSCARNN